MGSETLESRLECLRDGGWTVAVHNDYRLGSAFFTFWLFTHPDGRYVKGEAPTDFEAIGQVLSQAFPSALGNCPSSNCVRDHGEHPAHPYSNPPAASPPASTPGDAAGEARCPVCEHLFAQHADDGSGCLRNCGADICPCKRPRPASRTAPGTGTAVSTPGEALDKVGAPSMDEMTETFGRSRGDGGGAGAVKLGRDERRPMGRLREPAHVKVTKVVRTSFRVDWEYDGHQFSSDGDGPDPVRKRRVRFVQNKDAAYRVAAWRLIFARRDRYSKGFGDGGKSVGCNLCEEKPVHLPSERGPGGCRYHDDETVRGMCNRLARRLRWQDEAAQPPAAPPQGETR